jgi:hypothetical protein
MSNKRIAIFFSSLRGGGIENVRLRLARAFNERGFQVDLVLVRAEGPLLEQVPSGVNIIDLSAKRTLSALPALIQYLREIQPTMMLSSQTHNNVLAIWARHLSGSPTRLAVSEHTDMRGVIK